MGFTLSTKNSPGGSRHWWADYSGGLCYSGWLAIGESWACPMGAYGATDLHILVVDADYNTLHNNYDLGPIYDDKAYEYDCATRRLSEVVPESEFGNITIDSIEPTEAKIGDTVRITARVEHIGDEVSASIYAAIGIQGAWFNEILAGRKAWIFPQSSRWEAYLPYVDIPITSAIPPGVYDAYVKVEAPLLISPTVYDCVTISEVVPEEYMGTITVKQLEYNGERVPFPVE